MKNPTQVTETLRQLKKRGVHLCIDDFGTGYSSLAYLRELPVDELKLDKSFVDGFHAGGNAIVGEAVIGLCQTLGLELVAEGIEHADQATALRALRCERGQGYHFSRPVPASETWQLLRFGPGALRAGERSSNAVSRQRLARAARPQSWASIVNPIIPPSVDVNVPF